MSARPPFFPEIKRNHHSNGVSLDTTVRIYKDGIWYDVVCVESVASDGGTTNETMFLIAYDRLIKLVYLTMLFAKVDSGRPSTYQADEKERIIKTINAQSYNAS